MIKVIHQDNKSPVSGNFWSVSEFFVQPFLKKTGQKIQESEQKRSETGQIFFWSTKTTWTGLISSDKNFIHLNQQRVSH